MQTEAELFDKRVWDNLREDSVPIPSCLGLWSHFFLSHNMS